MLEREGKALVALNTLLIAGDLHAEIVARKIRIRDDAANRMIWNFALATGAAVALNPIPVADIAGGLAVDVGMIVALSKVYGIPLTRRTADQLGPRHDAGPGGHGSRRHHQPARGQRNQVVPRRLDHHDRRPGRSAHGTRLRGLRPGTGRDRRHDLVRPRPGGQDLPAPGMPVGPRGIKTVIREILAQAKADSVIDRLREDLKKRLKS